jgi:DNA-binding response OmpR family regulator
MKLDLERQVEELEAKTSTLKQELLSNEQRLMFKDEEVEQLKRNQTVSHSDLEVKIKELKSTIKLANQRIKKSRTCS